MEDMLPSPVERDEPRRTALAARIETVDGRRVVVYETIELGTPRPQGEPGQERWREVFGAWAELDQGDEDPLEEMMRRRKSTSPSPIVELSE